MGVGGGGIMRNQIRGGRGDNENRLEVRNHGFRVLLVINCRWNSKIKELIAVWRKYSVAEVHS